MQTRINLRLTQDFILRIRRPQKPPRAERRGRGGVAFRNMMIMAQVAVAGMAGHGQNIACA